MAIAAVTMSSSPLTTRSQLQRGFTLIELLVVISIIGLMASIAVTAVASARSHVRDARRLSDIQQLFTAMQLYYQDNGSFPTNPTNPTQPMSNDGCWAAYRDIDDFITPLYMASIPHDPLGHSYECYWYVPVKDGQGFYVMMKPELEATNATDQGCGGIYAPIKYCIGDNWQ